MAVVSGRWDRLEQLAATLSVTLRQVYHPWRGTRSLFNQSSESRSNVPTRPSPSPYRRCHPVSQPLCVYMKIFIHHTNGTIVIQQIHRKKNSLNQSWQWITFYDPRDPSVNWPVTRDPWLTTTPQSLSQCDVCVPKREGRKYRCDFDFILCLRPSP